MLRHEWMGALPAEGLLHRGRPWRDRGGTANRLAEAQAHATLGLAAATAGDTAAWLRTGEQPPPELRPAAAPPPFIRDLQRQRGQRPLDPDTDM
jgi:hypothetical protein